MNEQIKLLADQADISWLLEHHPKLEKFAELIVRECVGVVKGGRFLHDKAPTAMFAKECSRAIKRHFGVEDQVENSNQEHTCPYREEIHGDHKTLCNCDPEQTRQCAMDI